MPGYDIERFVGLSQLNKDELMCSICHDILCAPVVTNCCRQTFCDDCINNWLINDGTCPYDRQPLSIEGLSPPPRLLLNMLSKLMISCDFKDNGCPDVVTLEQLPQHTARCLYGLGKCRHCRCAQQKFAHNCVQSLLRLNRKVNQENHILKHELMIQMASNGQSAATAGPDDEIVVPVKHIQKLIDENIELKANISHSNGSDGQSVASLDGSGGDEPNPNKVCCAIF